MNKTHYLFLIFFSVIFACSCASDDEAANTNTDKPDSADLAFEHLRDSVIAAQGKQQIAGFMGNCMNNFSIPEQKKIEWRLPGPPTSEELTICGTWTAVMDEYGLRAEDIVTLADTGSESRSIGALMDAAKNGQRGEQKCAWLEFYDDHSGFWNSCIVEDGKPLQLVSMDVATRKQYPSGLRFDWYKEGNVIHIRLEDCLKYSLPYKDKILQAHARYWDLQIIKTSTDATGSVMYSANDYLPEYDYTSPAKIQYRFSKELDVEKHRNYHKPAVN